jgi:hypothetical protein
MKGAGSGPNTERRAGWAAAVAAESVAAIANAIFATAASYAERASTIVTPRRNELRCSGDQVIVQVN